MRFWGILAIFFLLAVDQLTKWLVLENLFRRELGLGDPMRFADWLQHAPERLPEISVTVSPVLNLAMVWNPGISFGLMAGGSAGILTMTSLAIAFLFFIWLMRANAFFEVVALAMIIGGALGNVIDRQRFGAVADFLDFHWQDWHFPTFNIADAAISLGVALLIIHGLFFARKTV